jgi:uncharacterized surface protein with fasciclin (FAS1) repeats
MKRPQWIRPFAAVAVAAALGVGALSSPAAAGNDEMSSSSRKQAISAIVKKTDDFSTLEAAVKAAGLTKTLKGEGPFTVFAPTDEAFAKIPQDQLNALLADKAALTNVLTYHVLGSKVPSSALQPSQEVTALNSEPFTITVEDGKATITDGQGNVLNIVKTDVKARNGIIHVIDAVMLPPTAS